MTTQDKVSAEQVTPLPWRFDIEIAPRDYPIEGRDKEGNVELIEWEEHRCCILGSRAGARGPGWQSYTEKLPVDNPENPIVAWRTALGER